MDTWPVEHRRNNVTPGIRTNSHFYNIPGKAGRCADGSPFTAPFISIRAIWWHVGLAWPYSMALRYESYNTTYGVLKYECGVPGAFRTSEHIAF